jgi:hypothetical protein
VVRVSGPAQNRAQLRGGGTAVKTSRNLQSSIKRVCSAIKPGEDATSYRAGL